MQITINYVFISNVRSIRNYLSIKDGFLNPKRSLSLQLTSWANKEVAKVLQENSNRAKCQRGKYNRYDNLSILNNP